MDRNQATGLILFAAVLLIYSLFFATTPQPENIEETQTEEAVQNAQRVPDQTVSELPGTLPDSIQDLKAQSQYGVFAGLVSGSAQKEVIENDKMIVTFSTKGGEITEVILKDFKSYDQGPLVIMDEDHSQINYQIKTPQGLISLNDFYFTPKISTSETEGVQSTQIEFTANTGSGVITRTYSLAPETYIVNNTIAFTGLSGQLTTPSVDILWEDRLVKQERDIAESRRKTNINFYTTDGSYDYLSLTSDADDETVSEPIKWMSFSQRFFTSSIIAANQFNGAVFNQLTPTDTLSVKNVKAAIVLPLEDGKATVSYFFGPNNYNLLKKITPGFENNVDMGYFFVSWVNKYIIVNLFQFLERFFTNYGVIIILIVFIIKLFLFPLTYKSYVGMAKMRVIKPEIDELKEKYKDDPTKQQQEQMKLFGKLGVSPISGCLPLLLQMPFLFAMFFFFPNSIELRQESFLWADDLSTYDSIMNLPFTIPFYGSHVSLFTLLMTISQIAYTRFNNQLTAASGPMKNLGYIMPIGFMFVLNSYPAALSFYYFVSNMVTFGQQALIKLFVDDEKIRAKVEESKLKNVNKKKSKFQQKLEDAMKAADTAKKKK